MNCKVNPRVESFVEYVINTRPESVSKSFQDKLQKEINPNKVDLEKLLLEAESEDKEYASYKQSIVLDVEEYCNS